MKKFVLALFFIILAISLIGCDNARTLQGFGFMGTYYTLNANGNVDSKKIENTLTYLENAISVDGELAKLNDAKKGESVVFSEIAYSLIKTAVDIYYDPLSFGALDISLYPIVKLWGFDSSFTQTSVLVPPKEEEILSTLSHVGLDKFTFSDKDKSITKNDDQAKLDLGALGKGYAVSYVLNRLNNKQAIFNLGGTVGAKGKDYKIGIEPPFESNYSYFASFILKDGEVCSTSGNYQRSYELDGVIYHHIFDNTGHPVQNDLTSVTVISSDGALSDALSTACYVLGEEKSKALLQKYQAKGVFVYKDKTVSTIDIDIEIKDEKYKLK